MMSELDTQYPGYGLASHKGYPTPERMGKLNFSELEAKPLGRHETLLVTPEGNHRQAQERLVRDLRDGGFRRACPQ